MTSWTPPSSAQNIYARPVNKGMILDQPPQAIPDGSFVLLRNFLPNKEGPRRRPPYQVFAGGASCPYKILDYTTVWDTSGSQINILITEKTLWKVSPSGLTEVPWVVSSAGTIDVTSLSVTGTATTWLTDDIRPGDLLRVGTSEGIIATIDSDTAITLESSTIADGTGLSYEVLATFSPGEIEIPDWYVYANTLLIADGKRPLIAYDIESDTVDYWIDDPGKYPSTGEFIACSVCGFIDRVWAGYTIDDTDGTQRQRVRWSALADKRDFSISTNYLDLPYVNGGLQRLLPMGDRLMAYFDDAVFMGTQTNYPLLPVQFDKMETGGIGLVGKKAITSFLGGHFWVGQDDMYLVSPEGAKRIGSTVARQSIGACAAPQRIYVAPDPLNSTIVFGMPLGGEYIERLWRFDYRADAWSYEDAYCSMVATPAVNMHLTWDSLPGTMDGIDTSYPTWDSMDVSDPRRYIYVGAVKGTDYYVHRMVPSGSVDLVDTPIECEIITRDHDYNEQDMLKTFVKFGLKIEYDTPLTENLVFHAYVSTNRGRTYKPVGQLVVRTGYDEGYVNFRATGSTFRIRLVSTSAVDVYYVAEYTIRVHGHGGEHDVSTQA